MKGGNEEKTMEEERIVKNEIKVADRDIRVYLGEALILFQTYDQITLSAKESFVEKMRYIANIVRAVGVEVDPEYIDAKSKKWKLIREEVEIMNNRTGRRESLTVNKLGLTKIPELFMYTDPDKAIEYPSLDDNGIAEPKKAKK